MISVKKSGKNIQPELCQKFVDGYQKPTGVQPNINRENVHIWARVDKRFMLYYHSWYYHSIHSHHYFLWSMCSSCMQLAGSVAVWNCIKHFFYKIITDMEISLRFCRLKIQGWLQFLNFMEKVTSFSSCPSYTPWNNKRFLIVPQWIIRVRNMLQRCAV